MMFRIFSYVGIVLLSIFLLCYKSIHNHFINFSTESDLVQNGHAFRSKNSPEEVLQSYLNCINTYQINKAKAYATPATEDMLTAISKLLEVMPEDEFEIKPVIELNGISCVLGDTTAICIACDVENNCQENLRLERTNKGWKVQMEKEEVSI
ncbi:MAG: hypothetical protein GY810_09145 [Aureispira sp.]|nr:hypothetical protein [Aureispira sp.]